MKKVLILTAITVLSFSVNAQHENKINRFYAFAAGGPAFFKGVSGNLGLSAVVKNKWIASIGYLAASRNASAPSDMNIYHSDGWFGSYDSHPTANTKFAYLSFGRYYPVSRRVSYILDAGIGLAKGQDFNYYDRGVSLKNGERIIYGASSNYIVTSTDKTALGLIGRAGMDWAFSGGAGMGFDFYYNYCGGGISDNVGFNIRLMIGYMPRPAKTTVKKSN